ncbi:hypothetical protein NEHOM01_1531 [Nematocida homosporus]|uniref:uncharacterized protein n=1 Tax=Nematocida homosporus TaxID=1912981 RepID=UPI00221FB714|nr:uncharacterized protein NEHOM01_1531 [Nematocida homosporus]KAI5186531.1 hypothetical protein NEHOM01_1531 [Nematocida homosporus]
MSAKKKRLLQRYLEKKAQQKQRDVLLERVRELQAERPADAQSFSTISRRVSQTKKLRPKKEIPKEEKEKLPKKEKINQGQIGVGLGEVELGGVKLSGVKLSGDSSGKVGLALGCVDGVDKINNINNISLSDGLDSVSLDNTSLGKTGLVDSDISIGLAVDSLPVDNILADTTPTQPNTPADNTTPSLLNPNTNPPLLNSNTTQLDTNLYKPERIKTEKSLARTRSNLIGTLPITYLEDDIVSAIKEHSITILTGGTGSGKSTQVPQFLYENGFSGLGKICLTQPRRVSALAVAQRIAQEQKQALGTVCGYKMRQDSLCSAETEIVVVTEGVLVQELAEDPLLSKYSVVILDEVHERSLHSDALFLILAKVVRKRGLRLVLMSAGITPEYVQAVEDLAQVKVAQIGIEPLKHEIEVHYLPAKEYNPLQEIQNRVFRLVAEQSESVLVFVATIAETVFLAQSFARLDRPVFTLHSKTPPKEQAAILSSSGALIIATNAAETSLTLPDVKYVVDGGREIEKTFCYDLGVYTYQEVLISRSSAAQRQGRTGRTGPGVCYRIYTAAEYNSMRTARDPAVRRERILPLVSLLLRTGVHPDKIKRVPYLTSPLPQAITSELSMLKRLHIIQDRLTEFGRQVLTTSLDPLLAAVVVRAAHESPQDLAALLSLAVRMEVPLPTYSSTSAIPINPILTPSQLNLTPTKTNPAPLHSNPILTQSFTRALHSLQRAGVPLPNPHPLFPTTLTPEQLQVATTFFAWAFAESLIIYHNGRYFRNSKEILIDSPLPYLRTLQTTYSQPLPFYAKSTTQTKSSTNHHSLTKYTLEWTIIPHPPTSTSTTSTSSN